MFGFGKKSISKQWEDVASQKESIEDQITDYAFSDTDEDQDSTSPFGFFKVHDTFDWKVTKGQNN